MRRGPDGREPGLFVHGLGGSATNWTDLMGLLEGAVSSEAVDLPGFGFSAPPPGRRYTVGAHARAVVAHLERSGRGPVHLFGNSLGGAVSTRVAADRPDLVRTLTLVSPALPNLRRSRGSDPRLPLLLLPGLSTLATRRLAAQTPEQRARAVLELCYADASTIPPQRLAEAADEVGRRNGLTHAQDAFHASLRGLVASYVARQRPLAVGVGVPGAGADPAGVGRPRPPGRRLDRPSSGPHLPRRAAARAARRRARRADGAPRDGGPGVPGHGRAARRARVEPLRTAS